MCGVFGYIGQQTDVGSAILAALKTLEYRGYDSGAWLSPPLITFLLTRMSAASTGIGVPIRQQPKASATLVGNARWGRGSQRSSPR
jgi:asparagine synthetase B (glutamine-hydrolysing)